MPIKCARGDCYHEHHLKHCRYCKQSFCSRHLNAVSPKVFDQNLGGHPCYDYSSSVTRFSNRPIYTVSLGQKVSIGIKLVFLIVTAGIGKLIRFILNTFKSFLFIAFILLLIFLYVQSPTILQGIIHGDQSLGLGTFINLNQRPISDQTMEIEGFVLYFTNLQRTQAGLKPLVLDPKLSEIARDHSLDMAQNNFFSHTNLKGEDPTARATRHGYLVTKPFAGGEWVGIGENIGEMPTGNVQGVGYVNSDPRSIAEAQVNGWMASPGHRANILNRNYDVIGIGTAYARTYYYSTQDFQ